MNDEDCSTICDRIQKEKTYEDSDQPAENGGPLYNDVHEDLKAEDNLYATELETHGYDSVDIYAVVGQESTSASFQEETGEYLLPENVYPEAQHPQPGEPQENGSEMEADLPSPSSFTIQHSRAFSTSEGSPTSYSADGVSEENESASTNPEMNLFVKFLVAPGIPWLMAASLSSLLPSSHGLLSCDSLHPFWYLDLRILAALTF
ncbi:chloride intracellular channel protein 5-like isoform X2 [Physeter macrocephalus]|nr:chloride intracellular channel protein 5-like isoform X2 [Physeter catodon]XP_054935932.1 chloride intracellular channel protein 5-like isoform X2 [Physeter catodon]